MASLYAGRLDSKRFLSAVFASGVFASGVFVRGGHALDRQAVEPSPDAVSGSALAGTQTPVGRSQATWRLRLATGAALCRKPRLVAPAGRLLRKARAYRGGSIRGQAG
jgi:hypothetical protein